MLSISSPPISTWTIPDYNISSYTLPNPVSNSTVPFTFTSSNSAVDSITGSTISILAAGTVTLTAYQDASLNFSSASTTKTITISDSYMNSSIFSNDGFTVTPKDLIFGTSDYTIELFGLGMDRPVIGSDGSTGTTNCLYVSIVGNDILVGYGFSNYFRYSNPVFEPNNYWHNVILVRKDVAGTSTHACFFDGTKHTSFSTSYQNTLPYNFSGPTNQVGSSVAYGNKANGYLANLRIVVGTALYDPANSTAKYPTMILSNVANTKLLLIGNNATDRSTPARTLTNILGVEFTPFLIQNAHFVGSYEWKRRPPLRI